MAYVDQKMSGSRVVAIVIVAVIHIALGYAFVTGLALSYVKKVSEKLNTFDVQEPPPPPPDEPPPPPPPDQPMTPPPVVAPPPIVSLPSIAPPVYTAPVAPPIYIAPPAPPAPPPPAPPRVSQAAGLKGNPAQYFGDDNYPPSAIRAEAQGRVSAKLGIGTDGRVNACTILSGSGNADLDDATCRIARSRVRFTPAKDQDGNPIASSYPLNVRWVLPAD